MAYIYVITNTLNQKQYVGKTHREYPHLRFDEHKRSVDRFPERPLYRAMSKYGIDNFTFEIIEETDEAIDRERYWISILNTYGATGYNATKGGDGATYLNHQKIISDYKKVLNMNEVGRLNDCHPSSVANILKQNKIETAGVGIPTKRARSISVNMIDIKSGEVLKTFSSQMEAARFVLENNYSNIADAGSASSKISLVCRGKRQTFAGFTWERV